MSEGFKRAFEIAFDRSANPMALSDDDRRYVRLNPATRDVFGWSPSAVLDTRIEDHMRTDEASRLIADWPRFLREGTWTGDMQLKTGSELFIHIEVHREANVAPHRHLSVMLNDVEAIEAAHLGDAPPMAMTDREAQVVTLVALGRSGEEIGRQLHISPETVRTHVRNAMTRSGARTRAHLIAIAMRTGAITPR